jgi:hypothetical protein
MTTKLEQLEKEVKYDFNNGGPLVWERAKERPNKGDLIYVEGLITNYKPHKHSETPVEKILVVTAEERNRRVEEVIALEPRADLNRLADVLLHDKLFNPSLTKMQDEEYPILSERQFDRRDNMEFSTEGDRMNQNASDRREHLKPTRRNRSDYENNYVDQRTKTRNAERKKQYKEFTKVQPVEVRKVGEAE